MNSKHTPGPWRVESEFVRVAKRTVADCCPDCGTRVRDDEEWQANARLIAAAPELLEALEGVMGWWRSTPAFSEGEDEMPAALFDAAMAAIAKAKGGAS